MPHTNQIKGLQPSRRTPGATYHWKPSPRERRHGFSNLTLGRDYDAACVRALQQNAAAERWFADHNGGLAATRRPPRIPRWAHLENASG